MFKQWPAYEVYQQVRAAKRRAALSFIIAKRQPARKTANVSEP